MFLAQTKIGTESVFPKIAWLAADHEMKIIWCNSYW